MYYYNIMTVHRILTAPDKRLRIKSQPVTVFDHGLHMLIDDMFDTMYDAYGIGLAAIQIGITKRVLVIDLMDKDSTQANSGQENHHPISLKRVFINPKITWAADDTVQYLEGCLSVPDYRADIDRPAKVNVSYQDKHGNSQQESLEGLLATCIQHEMDHLDGTLFIDHLSFAKRSMILRKLTKAKKLAMENSHECSSSCLHGHV